jgi:hypothetical protein
LITSNGILFLQIGKSKLEGGKFSIVNPTFCTIRLNFSLCGEGYPA